MSVIKFPGAKHRTADDLCDWATDSINDVRRNGNAKTIILIVETDETDVWHAADSLNDQLDDARLVGLLTWMTWLIMSDYDADEEAPEDE